MVERAQNRTLVTEGALPPNSIEIIGQPVIDAVYYGFHPDKVPKQIRTGEGSYEPASLANRLDRRDFLAAARDDWNNPAFSDKQKYRDEYAHFSEIEREFHAPRALELTHPEWGRIIACHVVLNREAALDQPPIMLIPGASNGVESMETLVREMALRQPDRRIYVLAYPDAPSGVVTPAFADAVKKASGFEPHAELFGAIINHLVPEGNVELWGYSTGAAIVSTLVVELKEMSQRVTNLLLMNPWGVVEQSDTQVKKGMIEGMSRWMTWLKDLPKWAFVNDPTKGEQKKLKMSLFLTLGKHGQQPVTWNNLSQVQLCGGGKVVVISGEKDKLTKSATVFPGQGMTDYLFPKQKVVLGVVSGAIHEGPFLQAKEFVNLALDRLER